MNTESDEKGWQFNLFKKRYPTYVYTIILAVFALIIYFWFKSATGM